MKYYKLTKEDKMLIKEAKKIIKKSRRIKLVDTAGVGSALLTSKGNLFFGVSLGFYCGIGSCGEYQAIGNMITNGEKQIKKIVAVTNEGEVIPPCGKCREMIHQTCEKNVNTEIIISETKKVKLKDLLPHSWGGTIEK